MSAIRFTEDQRRAIETVGRGVVVSAAAGSGKTAVLAERCAHLICDAPPPYRCNADELLVLTFTEAAAAEMRFRIVEALRARSGAAPHDERLREQLVLIDAAHISTIHAFCLWMIRRWFTEIAIDPTAAVLDEHEASLLRSEILDGVFTTLYKETPSDDHPLGDVSSRAARSTTESQPFPDNLFPDPLSVRFVALVDAYGLGTDREVFDFILRLHAFIVSLPDREAWLRQATDFVSRSGDRLMLRWFGALRDELNTQMEHCTALASALRNEHPTNAFYAERMEDYASALSAWLRQLPIVTEDDPAVVATALERGESVRRTIAEYEMDTSRPPSLSKGTADDVFRRRKATGRLWGRIRKKLFSERLHARFAKFSIHEWRQGLQSIEPHVTTLVDLVRTFDERYAARKRELNALDFSDLERFAHDLLRSPAANGTPSSTARALQRRFAHVLVDEFQDVNPLQQAILSLVSRESDQPQSSNLFVVGDVKQSIYRFRLAEPALFIERLIQANRGRNGDLAIPLQRNFRSLPTILHAVNLVFSQLMGQGLGEIVYDEQAELRPERTVDSSGIHVPVELHLLERRWQSIETQGTNESETGQDDNGPDSEDSEGANAEYGADETGSSADLVAHGRSASDDPAHWSPVEREGYLIGSRIRDWVSSGYALADGRPLKYGDCAVLLRAAKFNADQVAAMLQGMGIPAFASVSGSLFAALEVRDVLAALELLDNAHQDIPLVAVMRSGILTTPFSEDHLVAIRCHARDMTFHDAVHRYVDSGADHELRAKLLDLFRHVEHYRDEIRRRPLADVLWALYKQEGYLAYAGGLPNGAQRRANLHKLHNLARTFGSFRRQGLNRFLRFIRSLRDDELTVGIANAIGEAEDVVRVTSIHQAKGLEFPVVFLAGLGTRFNLGDRRGRMIFERHCGIGLRIVDPDRLIEYPSLAHNLAALDVERHTREEELRILYVAMTRARDQLVMIGSADNIAELLNGTTRGRRTLTRYSVASAQTSLDWLLPIVTSASSSASDHPPTFTLHGHDCAEMSTWRIEETIDPTVNAARRAAARLDPLPRVEPVEAEDDTVAEVLARTRYVYPHIAVSSVPSTMAAGAFKGAFDIGETDTRPVHAGPRPVADAFADPPSRYEISHSDSSTLRGIATHRILQHLDFSRARNGIGVASELRRLIDTGLLTEGDREMVDREAIEWFVSTPLAEDIRTAGDSYRREFHYVASESPTMFDETVRPAPGDFVLVRGIVDGILPTTDGMEIVDFKTDHVVGSEIPARVEHYRRQMTLYGRAVSRMWRRPLRGLHLVFLHPRIITSVPVAAAAMTESPAWPNA